MDKWDEEIELKEVMVNITRALLLCGRFSIYCSHSISGPEVQANIVMLNSYVIVGDFLFQYIVLLV